MKVPPDTFKGRLRRSNVVNPDDHRTQRGSDRKLGQLLGIAAGREDGLPNAERGNSTGLLPPFSMERREPEDERHAEQWRVPAGWSYAGPGVDTEEQRLIDVDPQEDVGVRGKDKGKFRRTLVGLIPFRRRKAARRASLPGESAQNPFGDEHAINRGGGGDATAQDEEMEVEMDTHDGPFPIPVPSTPSRSGGQWVTFPSLAAARSVSAPTTPKRSPRRRTPGSAKSWLSEVSNTSGSGSSLLRRSVRRRARLSGGHEGQMRSMQKTVQVLGPEAAGAVTKGTEVSPNKLRYMNFERQLRLQMRRQV